MEIKVLGSGCPSCIRLEKSVQEVLKSLGKEAHVEKVTDFDDIASYGVMSTPALVVDGVVLFSGKVPNSKKLSALLNK